MAGPAGPRPMPMQSVFFKPKPSWDWYMNGVAINKTSKKHEIVNCYFKSYLILNYFSSKQTVGGVYACAAVNDVGKVKQASI